MTVNATVLFEMPQHEVASLIRRRLATCERAQIVSGFVTVEGVATLERVIASNPKMLTTLVVGAGTYRAYEGLDRLIGIGVPAESLFVHLGHTRETQATAKHRFYRYHPMLHSKVYYMEYADGSATAIVGSHNITGFALNGLNGEAGVLLEGALDSPEFERTRRHIRNARAQSVQYSSGMKEAFSWWTHQFMEGLSDKSNDIPRDAESKKTIVILAESEGGTIPQKNDVIYFELPSALGQIASLRAEVHLYIFDKLPATPWEGLQSLHTAKSSLWCKTLGLEMEQGGVELRADWQIDDHRHPVLRAARRPFRPQPTTDMQQVRVQAYNTVFGTFEYLFEAPSKGWLPELDRATALQAPPEERNQLSALKLLPNPEDVEWYLVRGLTKAELPAKDDYGRALDAMSPSAGSFVLMSLRRRQK